MSTPRSLAACTALVSILTAFVALPGNETSTQPAAARAGVSERLVYEREIPAPVAAVWKAFTRADELRGWMAPVVEIDLKIGGLMRSSYTAEAQLGDPSTITSEILSFDPERMLSMRAVGFPEGFPWAEAAAPTWSIFYFDPVDENTTRITMVGNGYGDDEASRQMKAFFEVGNSGALDELAAWLARDEAAAGR